MNEPCPATDLYSVRPGVKHWHGAAPDGWFSHLAVEVPGENGHSVRCEPVSGEAYAQLRRRYAIAGSCRRKCNRVLCPGRGGFCPGADKRRTGQALSGSGIFAQRLLHGRKRNTPFGRRSAAHRMGLTGYYTEFTAAECCDAHIIESYTVRTGIPPACTEENGRNIIAEWESGWDYNPRYSGRCTDYNPVDPNCLLYHDEVCWSAGRKGCRTRRRPKNIGHWQQSAKRKSAA